MNAITERIWHKIRPQAPTTLCLHVQRSDFIFNKSQNYARFSPAAIIRNATIWTIILLLAFFRTLSSNLDVEYPAVSEKIV